MAKHGYNFGARSRAAMADAIESIGHERGYHGSRYPFCFNVKLWDGWDSDAAALSKASGGDYELRPEWDSEWESYVENNGEGLFMRVAESLWQSMVEDYSTYPGDDSGEWQFESAGRSGGWLCLVSGPGFDFRNRYLGDIVEEVRGSDPLERFSWDDCKRLYRALVCMDRDFRREAITAETRYQLAYIRHEWEQEREAEARDSWRSSVADRTRALGLRQELRGGLLGDRPSRLRTQIESDVRTLLDRACQLRRAAWELLGDVPLAAILASPE